MFKLLIELLIRDKEKCSSRLSFQCQKIQPFIQIPPNPHLLDEKKKKRKIMITRVNI